MNRIQNDSSESSTTQHPNRLLIGPSSRLRAPSSLLSSSLPPSLLQEGENVDFLSATNNPVAMRPRRLWAIQDTALKRVPQGFPPMNPYCTTYVGDTSPSVIAVRISECFRKRSIAVEYDDETVTATALTVDRCSFQVQLYKGNSDLFSHGVIVECMRISGAVTSFHAACRAVLQAALGQSTGDDSNRPLYHCNGREFQRLPDPLLNPGATVEMNAWKPSADVSAAQAFEEAKELIHKDRLDTQVLGMERLVDLTSPSVCGNHISLHISLQLVKEDPLWIVKHVISNDKVGSRRKIHDSSSTKSMIGSATTSDEGHHVSKLRALGLRVLCNALSLLAEMEILCHNLQGSAEFIHPMTEIALLDSLIEDLKGVNRPPSVVQSGTNTLASAHEATLALRILRILGESSETVRRFLDSDVVLDRMETAQTCGRATHLILQHEAERTYAKLTEDIRSC